MKRLFFVWAFLSAILHSQAQEKPTTPPDTTKTENLQTVTLKATRVNAESPVTYSELKNEDYAPRNLGQDLPILLNYLPNVVTTSDAGAGIGYTGIRVRGSDATRVNVTINGVPYNDAESQGTFWVNLPDFASSVESLQLQRGVGTSTNGSGAFGASLNLKTTDYNRDPFVEIGNSFGSFNSRRHNIKFSTGLLDGKWEFNGRASQIKSDGFVDRASSDLRSYYVSGAYISEKTLVKAIMFGGFERTYQAWYGVDAQTLENDRTFNPAGLYIDEDGNTQFYDQQVDNYNQNHYQLLFEQELDRNLDANVTLHYTDGRGYFQEYIESDFYAAPAGGPTFFELYGLESFESNGETVTSSDVITRRWLDNEFYGFVSSLTYDDQDMINASLGLSYNRYEGDHYGEIVSGEFIQLDRPLQRFYEGTGDKNEFNAFAKANFKVLDNLNAYVDFQLRRINYETGGDAYLYFVGAFPFEVDRNFSFFNPKAGLTYRLNEDIRLYASVARAQREPNRTDFINGSPEPEDLIDYELGMRWSGENFDLNVNGYYMDYKNQLVLTGEVDNQGFPIRANSGDSYRLGLEVDARVRVKEIVYLQPNFSISQNRNQDFFITDENRELVSLGDTEIAYSPSIVAGNALTVKPLENLELSLLTKYVGEQQLTNTGDGPSIDSFFVNDLNVQYVWKPENFVDQINFKLLVNNLFDTKYVNNGLVFGDFVSYFPQAGINFLTGIDVRF